MKNYEKDLKKLPLITVVTVVLNGSKTLENTILSVINQSYQNVQFIIIDGGSTDGTLDIILRYEDKIETWVSEPDKGIYDAWNKAITLASGDWIAFLGADDIYLDGAIETYVKLINEFGDNEVDYISSRVNLIQGSRIIRTIGREWNWRTFKRYMCVAHVGSLHNRKIFDKYGLYDTTYKICGDYELLLRPRQKLKAKFINITTACMAVGGVSNNNPVVFDEVARIKIEHRLNTRLGAYIIKIYTKFKYSIRIKIWY